MKTTIAIAVILTANLASAQQAAPAAKAEANTSTSAKATADKLMDARFNTWLGCWRLEDDLAGTGARMCITPEQTGVRLQTIVGTQHGLDELVIADGTARPIVDSECTGTAASEWSQDGLRVFRSIDVACKNESSPRIIKSIAFLAPGAVWTLVQHVNGGAETASVRVQRYRRAFNQNLADGTRAPQPRGEAGALVSAREMAWNIDDVIEASGKLPEEALQAALSDVRHGFNMNKTTLVKLADAEVPASVIDLMVALTFPKRFVVERGGGGGAPVGVSTGMGWYDPFMSPLFYGAYGNCYNYGYYGYRSYYNLCGYYPSYSPYYNGNYYYPGSGWVIVDNPGGGGAVETGTGRAVNGRGYTQIRERSPEPPASRASGGNGSAGGWSGASAGGGVSSGGYSSGSSGSSSGGGSSSSGGDGGRTAVARPPGGN